MDLSMPVMDGFECACKIREVLKYQEQPMIVVISGHTEEEYI